jgi:Flp pilus assembly protein TadG
MVVLIAFLGLAIDVGQMRYHRRQLQMAADSAAIAGALERLSCAGTANCAAMQTASQDALTENEFTGSTLLTNCAAGTGTRLEISVNNPPCAVASDPNKGNNSIVEVTVSQPQPTVFARVLGIQSVPLRVRGEAAQSGGGNCIYALDPNGSEALAVDFLASLSAQCGIFVESSSSSAPACSFFATIRATHINVTGGISSQLCSISPTAATGVAVLSVADPLASLPQSAVPACSTTTKSPQTGSKNALAINSTVTLYPRKAYCAGITIGRNANVTFEPGVYLLRSSSSAGGLAIDIGATVNGTGVTFYNYGSTGSIAFSYPLFVAGVLRLLGSYSRAAEFVLIGVNLTVKVLTVWLILRIGRRVAGEDPAMLPAMF